MEMKRKIFFIDPQTLGMYDYELLSRIGNNNVYFLGSKFYNYLPMNNIKSKLWFKYGKYKNNILKGISYVLTMLRICVYILIKMPKVIHIQWIRVPVFDYCYYSIIKKCLKIKLVYTVHNILPHTIKQGDYEKFKRFYDLCDILIVHTNTTKRDLSEEFNINLNKIIIAPHGPLIFKENKNNIDAEVEMINDKYKLRKKIVFSILGTQSEYKGTDLLVDAWLSSEKLRRDDEKTLIIAGQNADKYLKSKNTHNIIVIDGILSDLTFKALIRRSDVIVLPYRRIEQSGVLLSLIIERVPYCATDVGELAIPIKEENIGWIIPEVSANSIKETLEKIVENVDEIQEKAGNIQGWTRIFEYYDWNTAAKITEKIYSEV